MSTHPSTPQIFEPNYYQRLYDLEEGHWWARGMRSIMTATLHPWLTGQRKLKVLDIGCGTGYLMTFLTRYSVDGDVTGIDYSAHALRFCQEQRGLSRLALGDAIRTPFADQSFDLIICIDTIQHLWPAGADQTALNEFARLLRPGGVLYLRTNSALGHPPLKGVDPNLYRRYHRAELNTMVERAGLGVHTASYINFVPGLWAALKEYLTRNRPASAPIGPGLTIKPPSRNALTDVLYQLVSAEGWLIGRGVSLPFGHSLLVVATKR